jgi:hypothetical protein
VSSTLSPEDAWKQIIKEEAVLIARVESSIQGAATSIIAGKTIRCAG